MSKYHCIDFEGGDQVGKGDAVKNISLELANLGYKICVVAFPYYATPFGYVIRDVLVNGFPSEIVLDKNRQVEIKMLLFALNRLEILNALLSMKKYDVYVFDRGPFSNALTIAYHVFGDSKNVENEGYLANTALEFDSYFRNILGVDDCVICLKQDGVKWEESRSGHGDDLHERREVQDISGDIYKIFEEKVGSGWKNVVTKNSEGWRERGDIKEECLQFVKESGVIKNIRNMKSLLPEYLLLEDIQKFLYQGSDLRNDLHESWKASVIENDKKEVYRVSEFTSMAFSETTERLVWNNTEIRGEILKYLTLYPEIFDIIEYRYGKRFVSKLKKSLR